MNNNGVQPRNENGFAPHLGGTALGGPSGNDEDGSFTTPYAANVHTHSNVNEYSKDDHSVKVKDTHVHPPYVGPGPYGPALGPGAGPFPVKRGWPSGGTAEGGPSGNDEGQSFNMPITGNFQTDVNESSDDDHSVKVKDTHVHHAPVIAPVHPVAHFDARPAGHPHDVEGPPHFNGRPHFEGPPHFGGPPHPQGPPHFNGPTEFEPGHKGPTNFEPGHNGPTDFEPGHHGEGPNIDAAPHVEGTHVGPTGGIHQANDNNNNNDNGDHFHIAATDLHHDWQKRFGPPEVGGTALGGPSGGGHGPAGFHGHGGGGTALGGPSGDDGGINYGRPIDVDTHAGVNEYSKDDHSVDVKHTDIYPAPVSPFGPPFKRGWGHEHGGTALGGPSGDDEGQSFNMPITVNTHTGVNEYSKDDHSTSVKNKHITDNPVIAGGPGPYIPEGGVFRRAYAPDRVAGGGGGGTAEGGPSGDDDGVNFGNPTSVGVDSNVNEHHEDNHSVKVDDTHVDPPHYAVPEYPWMTYPEATYEVPRSPPVHETPEVHQDPREDHEEVPQCHAETHEVVRTVTKTQYKEVHPTETVYQQPATSVVVQTSAVPMGSTPMDQPASKVMSSVVYGTQAVPAPSSTHRPYQSYNYNSQRPMSTPAYSMIPVHIPMASPSASASASPSHGTMFTGAASRVSGGLFSAAAAVAGVLAFVL
ncbi:hypothetical protein N7532_009582 [Penicillium argentinense]|uniref:GPI anchored protein n=1 Tax=Penicillium argentinense TaxID=1131581 RepID=A0A9W9K2P9_9EURO|nr:uncharacterized protein N7532_009582 [Penicillium argentinense]KAJ5090898.1 hypothetical protein N7532_009582 [Penicillium argentinense]